MLKILYFFHLWNDSLGNECFKIKQYSKINSHKYCYSNYFYTQKIFYEKIKHFINNKIYFLSNEKNLFINVMFE